MRLYKHTNKRRAKKFLGKYFNQLSLFRNLKVGDLVFSCRSLNERITQVVPGWGTVAYKNKRGKWVHLRKPQLIWDFGFIVGSGAYCSAIHCLDLALTHDEILEYYKSWKAIPKSREHAASMNWQHTVRIFDLLEEGKDPFNDQGELVEEEQNGNPS